MVKCVGFLFLKKCSLVENLGETYCCCATWRFWLVGDIGSSGIAILGECISNIGNHFLNRRSKIGPE